MIFYTSFEKTFILSNEVCHTRRLELGIELEILLNPITKGLTSSCRCYCCCHFSLSDSLQPHGCSQQAPLSMGFSRKEYWSGLSFPPAGDFPNPGIEPRSPTLSADSLSSEPLGKPKNTGVGSLFLLQGIFPTQKSNWGLLHCRQILYPLSYLILQGSADFCSQWGLIF